MTKIAILRGINVGGRRKILMADLKAMFADLGFTAIKTYIQSGNVLFTADTTNNNTELASLISNAIQEQFGFDVPVIVRTAEEIASAVKSNPFYKEEVDISHLHLTFLSEVTTLANKEQTESYNYEPDQFVIADNNVFVYCEGKYHKSKLSNNFFEKKLKVNATTRNWKTVLKLLELSTA